jgi:hypothetical protein
MSFIYDDPNLIDQLVVFGLDFANKFTKRGQVAGQDRALLLDQIKNLQNQLNPTAPSDPNAKPIISHKGEASLGFPQLQSLGDLIKWLVDNETAVNGKRIADAANPNDASYVTYNLPDGTAYVNPELLKQYIISLQARENEQPNEMMQRQMAALIKEADQALGIKVDPQYHAPEKVLPDNAILDNLPQILSGSGSYAQGPEPLTYGDLKTPENFHAWLQKIQLWDEASHKKVSFNQKEFDIPKIVALMLDRAKFLDSRATPDNKEHLDVYVKQMQQLNSQVGNQAAAPPAGVQPSAPTSTGTTSPNQNLVNDIVETLPLALQNIDFNRIRDFFGKIAELMSNNPTVMNYIQTTNQLMSQASAITANEDTFYQLGISAAALADMFRDKQTPGKYFFPMVNLLRRIVENVRQVVGYFMSQYANNLTSSQRAYLFGQIGKRPDDTSIYSRNIEYLDQWNRTPHN